MSLGCFRSLLVVVLFFFPQKVLPKGKVEWSGVGRSRASGHSLGPWRCSIRRYAVGKTEDLMVCSTMVRTDTAWFP